MNVRRVLRSLLLLGCLSGIGVVSVQAQVFTPTFMAPRPAGDVGIYVSDGPGDFSIEGIWRQHFGGYDLGFRGGVASADDAALLVGAELRNPLQLTGAPISLAFTAGLQAVIGDRTGAGFQAGLTAGHTFVPGNFSITPYLHPRIGLVSRPERDGLDANILADVGFDFDFQPNLSFRIGLGLANETASWGIGLAWR